jgi:arabinose-5-phosphate isomerase
MKVDPRIESAIRILDQEARAVTGLRERVGPGFVRAVEMILGLRGRVVTTGMGKAGIVAIKVSATLASTGTPSIYLHPAEALHGDLGRCVKGDLLVAFSKSGETEEVLRLLPLVKACGVGVLAVTQSRDSTLGRLADHVLELGPIDEAGRHALAPSASTLAMMALGDALALVVQEGRDFGPEEFARFHPAGDLGRKLMRVGELMRKAERNPTVRAGSSVRQAIVCMSETPGRPGAANVVDEHGMLLGFFTDGDLRRHLKQRTDNLLERQIDEVMTRSPKTITPDRLAAEALAVLQQFKVDNMPVVDEAGRAVGLIDLQDLLELKF